MPDRNDSVSCVECGCLVDWRDCQQLDETGEYWVCDSCLIDMPEYKYHEYSKSFYKGD